MDLADAAALWSAGRGAPYAVVDAACAALVAGFDGYWLRTLAAAPHGWETGDEVDELLYSTMAELGLPWQPRFSHDADEAAIRALARRLLRGEMTSWELARIAHAMFGHEPGPTENLGYLDDVYDSLEVIDVTVEEINERCVRRRAGLSSRTANRDHRCAATSGSRPAALGCFVVPEDNVALCVPPEVQPEPFSHAEHGDRRPRRPFTGP